MGIPLNVDVAASISKLKDALKDFELRLKLYRILFQGKGLDFEGYRTYTQADDASLIDWKSSMRSNKTLVKEYKEEQDIKIVFAVDVGEHMLTGSSNKLKAEYVTEVVAALMHLVMDTGDRVGLITYNSDVTNYIPPKRGNNHFNSMIDVLSDSNTYGKGSNFKNVLNFINNYLDSSVKAIILVSDFIRMRKDVMENMQVLSTRFETLAMMIKDPIDRTLPDVSGEVIFEDPMTGNQLLVNPRIAAKAYERNALIQEQNVLHLFKESNVDVVNIPTDQDFAPTLGEFIKERVRKRKFL